MAVEIKRWWGGNLLIENYGEYVREQTHLAAVAKEALRVESGKFVHKSIASVVRGLREQMQQGNQWLKPDLSDETLSSDISMAGAAFDVGEALGEVKSWEDLKKYLHMPLKQLMQNQELVSQMSSEAWVETLNYFSEVLPEETRAVDISLLLMGFPKLSMVLPGEGGRVVTLTIGREIQIIEHR